MTVSMQGTNTKYQDDSDNGVGNFPTARKLNAELVL